MNRVSYDDWNSNQEETEKKPFNAKGNSSVFLICSFILLILGIINVYSMTFPRAVTNGLSSYYYVLQYIKFAGLGLAAGLVLLFLPRSFIKVISFMISTASIAGLWLNVYLNLGLVFDEAVYTFIFTFLAVFLSSHFAKSNNCIDKYSFLAIPIIFCMGVLWGILLNGNITFAVIFVIFTGFIFLSCGCGLTGLLLLLLYYAIPVCIWCFSNQQNLNIVYEFFLKNGISSVFQKNIRMQCISQKAVSGNGIGLGIYKTSGLDGMTDLYALCNVVDEVGILGFGIVLLLFFICFITCVKSSVKSSKTDVLSLNVVTTLEALIVIQIIINIVQIYDLASFYGITMPFFSLSANIAVSIVQTMLIFKYMHIKTSNNVRRMHKSNEEVVFERSYYENYNS